ncbi:hypothetical protein [Agriterribacter sp.]|uniref:hypothetical protein n=1 Tax=Agriterribacter sp. TaxID=2821509 RepID=UPI002BBBA9D8|nr:hypothetical protein [Agriterribacter sp.]HRO46237.1 hypothetical protein [Agriterribacter sp.]HRQ18482.1 hypothetical protein [Agriterribacter sp.]
MQPFDISLPGKKLGHVINKRIGIRRPAKFLFFKYKNKERIIAYTVIVEGSGGKNEFMVFKTQKKGAWLKGARKNGENISVENERMVSSALKNAIDEFERKQGGKAYQELF